MDDNKLYYPCTDNTGLDSMTEHHNRKVLPVSLSPEQLEQVEKSAKEAGVNRSEFVRNILRDAIKDFPADLPGQGKYERTPKN